MMVPKMHAFFGLSLLLLGLTISNASTVCPADCTCSRLTINGESNQLHAKCKSLSAFATRLRDYDNIDSIDCSGCGLETTDNEFAQLTNVRTIDLSHNNLTRVPRLARRVHTLDLSNNRIVSEKLQQLPLGVRTLNLAHNQLTEVSNKLLQLDHLESLDLTGNMIKCNCDTIHARNWLHSKRVKSRLVCSSPTATKGLSWDEVRISDVCDSPTEEIWDIESNDMLNDQAIGDAMSLENAEEEFGKDYLPFEQHVFKRQIEKEDTNDTAEGSGADTKDIDLTGSGDSELNPLRLEIMDASLETTTVAEEEEGSGNTGSVIAASSPDIETNATSTTTEQYEDELVMQPQTLGIFKETVLHKFDETTPIPETTEDEVLLARITNSHSSSPVKTASQATEENTETSESTYVLLLILGILLVGLIAFVVIRKRTANARRDADAENANGKEMLVMSKDRLGKPINGSNGNNGGGGEVIPLIGERDKWNPRKQAEHQVTRPDQEELKKAQEPLLQKIDEPLETEAVPAQYTNTSRPSSVASNNPRYENNNNNELSPKSENPEIHKNNDPAPESTYAPISPKPARYSPVYSPETGRVKIKLAETPKPRTPMLVNRTRSNAGELITTPLRKPE